MKTTQNRNNQKLKKRMKDRLRELLSHFSLTAIFTIAVGIIVAGVGLILTILFLNIYYSGVENNAITTSNQAVAQVQNTVDNYTEDMKEVLSKIHSYMNQGPEESELYISNLLTSRSDVVAVTTYDQDGNMLNCWSDDLKKKDKISTNLSYVDMKEDETEVIISKPHVETIFEESFPWVVTLSQMMVDSDGQIIRVALDIRFSQIANYVDDVGIGQHGYCYIIDQDGEIIYHPQQQLINSGLKEEPHEEMEDGTHLESSVIYTVRSQENSNWRIVGVCYADEMITDQVAYVVKLVIGIFFAVMLSTLLIGFILAQVFNKPANELKRSMELFEGNAEQYQGTPIKGSSEITALSQSFDHMAKRITRLVEQIREEEIMLRKTELNALQSQINPHFLYNTLDSIAWMCEEGRNEEAESMVNALARLFRISISKGHELITIEKEVQHAKSYLQIQNFRYHNQFTYSFDVAEECLPYLCNKITLQPIIENAINHGIGQMVDEGVISIRIWMEEDDIVFSVQDNGVGMSEEQCYEVLHKTSESKTGIGVKNVDARVKIYFGNQYGVSIQSELDEGTCVMIHMPKIEEGSYDEKENS